MINGGDFARLRFWERWFPSKAILAELPPRTRGMVLNVPRTRGIDLGFKSVAESYQQWPDLAEHPVELLREIKRFLVPMNREAMLPGRRVKWADHSLNYACAAIRKIYSEQHKGDAVPESHDRREGLIAAIECCAQLAIAYKHVLKHDYRLTDKRFYRARGRFEHCAVQVLNLIRVEQRLRALRYQKLPPETWLDANQIFFAMAECELTTTPAPELTCLRLQVQGRVGSKAPTVSNLHDLYVAIQVFGFLETGTMAVRSLYLVDFHLAQVRDSLHLVKHDGGVATSTMLVCNADRRLAPLIDHAAAGDTARKAGASSVPVAMRLDIAPLLIHLRREYGKARHTLERPELDDQARVVVDKEDTARLLVLENMLYSLDRPQRGGARRPTTGANEILVYLGFMAVYRLLAGFRRTSDDAPVFSEHQLRDALAGASALIADDSLSAGSGRWVVVDESAGGVLVTTQETQFTNAIYVGQLVAYAWTREALEAATIGYVARLHRAKPGEVEVFIRKLSDGAESTVVQSAFLNRSDMGLPGLLLENADGQGRLLLHHSHRLAQGAPVFIYREGARLSQVPVEMEMLQREFVVFQLQAAAAAE